MPRGMAHMAAAATAGGMAVPAAGHKAAAEYSAVPPDTQSAGGTADTPAGKADRPGAAGKAAAIGAAEPAAEPAGRRPGTPDRPPAPAALPAPQAPAGWAQRRCPAPAHFPPVSAHPPRPRRLSAHFRLRALPERPLSNHSSSLLLSVSGFFIFFALGSLSFGTFSFAFCCPSLRRGASWGLGI